MADDKTAKGKKGKKKELLRRLREWLLAKSKGETVATQEKQIKELFPEDKKKGKKNG